MSGSFVHKIIIAGCRCFDGPLASGPHQEDEDADNKAASISTSPESARSGRDCGDSSPDGGGVCSDPPAFPIGRGDSLYTAFRAATAAPAAKLDDRSTR